MSAGGLRTSLGEFPISSFQFQIYLDQEIELDDGGAWVGFTSGTWDAYEDHDILNWAFTGTN